MNTTNSNIVIGRLTDVSNLPLIEVSWSRVLDQNISKQVLHLFYPVKDMKKKVEMLTSYLGKFRRSENTAHLLDLLSLTGDESDLFMQFYKEGAAEVFDCLARYMPNMAKSYQFENGNTVSLDDDITASYKKLDWVEYNGNLYLAVDDGSGYDVNKLDLQAGDYRDSAHYFMEYPETHNSNAIAALDTAIESALAYYIIYNWLLLSFPVEANGWVAKYQLAIEKVRERASARKSYISQIVPRQY